MVFESNVAIGDLVPIRDYWWNDDLSWLRSLTCANHTDAAYLTKNPFSRGIHLIKRPEGDMPRSATGECLCPFSDLRVVIGQEDLDARPNV
jgi:hypothetical protein